MSAGIVVASDQRVRIRDGTTALCLAAAAFVVGVALGSGLPRAGSGLASVADQQTHRVSLAGVASNNMSDAARQALYGTSAPAGDKQSVASFAGVASNNMSDAARQALYGASKR